MQHSIQRWTVVCGQTFCPIATKNEDKHSLARARTHTHKTHTLRMCYGDSTACTENVHMVVMSWTFADDVKNGTVYPFINVIFGASVSLLRWETFGHCNR